MKIIRDQIPRRIQDKYQCMDCGHISRSLTHLLSHMRKKHDKIPRGDYTD